MIIQLRHQAREEPHGEAGCSQLAGGCGVQPQAKKGGLMGVKGVAAVSLAPTPALTDLRNPLRHSRGSNLSTYEPFEEKSRKAQRKSATETTAVIFFSHDILFVFLSLNF